MDLMKTLLFTLMLSSFVADAQKLEVKKEESRIEGQNTPGYQIAFTAPENEVRSSLSRYLKTLGKTRNSGDYITVAGPLIEGKKYTATLYATTKQAATTTSAWIGLYSEETETGADRNLEKITYNFGVTFQREQIQAQIDESLRALQTVEKQQGRLTNQDRDLRNKIENNKQEKVQLEKSLVENKLELEALTLKLEANGRAQDSVAVAAEQIKKVVEMHKARQKNVQ